MKIKLFQFNKKLNSTKQPTGGVEYDITLKEGCNIINPAVNFSRIANPTAYNYAYIPDFGRYYFVSNWEAYRDRWTASLAVDVLASYKQQIGASSQYIGRSESDYDPDVIDGAYPAAGALTIAAGTTPTPWATNFADGTFIVQIINDETASTGAVYYAMSVDNYNTFRAAIGQTGDFWDLVKTGITSPYDYITSCKWFPIKTLLNPSRLSSINRYGPWAMDPAPAADVIPNNGRQEHILVFNIPKHPQIATRGSYLQQSPYSRYSLFLPPFGLITLDPSQLYDRTILVAEIIIDLISGAATANIRLDNVAGSIIGTYNANFAVDLPLNTNSISLSNTATNLLSAASSVIGAFSAGDELTTAAAVGAGLKTGSNVVDAVMSALPQVQNITSGGSGLTWTHLDPSLILFAQEVVEENPDLGRPLCALRTINTLNGFVQIPDPHFDIAATDSEKTEIESAARAGFFYE